MDDKYQISKSKEPETKQEMIGHQIEELVKVETKNLTLLTNKLSMPKLRSCSLNTKDSNSKLIRTKEIVVSVIFPLMVDMLIAVEKNTLVE